MWTKIKALVFRWFYRLLSARAWRKSISSRPDDDYSVIQIATPQGQMALRIYASSDGGDKPLIVYFHGGGWVIGDLGTHHPFCRELCARSGCTVVSVDYRLAPEHPWPAAHDDCFNATSWISNNLATLGPNNQTMVLTGDSAGANLASCTCLQLGEAERARVAGEILIYPVTDHYSKPYPSYSEKGKGYALSSGLMFWFWDTYLGGATPFPENTTPLRAENLHTLPPTLLITAENDPLRDEGIAYGEKLRNAGVEVQYKHFENDQHGFACSEGPTPSFNILMADISTWVGKLERAA